MSAFWSCLPICMIVLVGCTSDSLNSGPPAGEVLLLSENLAPEQRPKSILTLFADAHDVLWNQEGNRIYSSSGHVLRTWNVVTRQEMYAVSHGAHINGAALNSDESLIFTWSDERVVVWDADTGEQLRELTVSDGKRLKGVAWNRDDNRIFNWGPSPAFLGVWNGETRQNTAVATIPDETLEPFSNDLAWNRARTQFLSWGTTESDRPLVRLWQVDLSGGLNLDVVAEFRPEGGVVEGAVWSPDETRIAVWSRDHVTIWDVATQEVQHTLPVGGFVAKVRWSPDAGHLAMLDIQATAARILDVDSGDEVLGLDNVRNLAWEVDDGALATWADEINLWGVPDGRSLVTVETELPPTDVQWHGDGIRMLVLLEGVVQIWVLPREGRCVVHGLANVRVRNGPGTEFTTVNTLQAHITAEVSARTMGTDSMQWWQVAEDRWIRSDVVEPTGDCSAVPKVEN